MYSFDSVCNQYILSAAKKLHLSELMSVCVKNLYMNVTIGAPQVILNPYTILRVYSIEEDLIYF